MTLILFALSVLASGVAAVSGFGIGSLITPVLSLGVGTKIAIAAVSIPHFVATAMRFWILREHLDRKVFLSFGVTSAVGGLLGALLHASLAVPAVTLIFAGILIFVGFIGLGDLAKQMRFHGFTAWLAGFFSGVFGGLVGNQGGIRSAALLGFELRKEALVATGTAVGLIVDGVRMPVYFYNEGQNLLPHWPLLAVMIAGVIPGTLIGGRILKKIPELVFRRTLSSLLLLLGLFMMYRGIVA